MCDQVGVPPIGNVMRKTVAMRVNVDIMFGDGLPKNCAGTQDFNWRRQRLTNECGLSYHRQFSHGLIEAITFFRVPDTRRMRLILPLSERECQWIRDNVQVAEGVQINFELYRNEKLWYIPGQFK